MTDAAPTNDSAAPFDPQALPPLREVIARFGLDARKALGQNFLLDLNLTGRIARSAGDMTGVTAVEVGPGPGGLTRALLATKARQVIAIERDHRFIEALQDVVQAANGRLAIVEGDALEVDPIAIAPAPRAIVANLPYNVATPLLIGWLARIEEFVSLTLMFQKEVADRLVAKPGSKAYGRLSVITQWRADARVLFNLPAKAFTPPPKVASTVVHLTPRANPEPAEWKALEQVTAAAFGQRRKMLRQSLKSLGDAEALLAAAGIEPTARAEEVSVAKFAALARAYRANIPLPPREREAP
ncbi:16S rRNA (adenine(1518)-N(6)/adenine(1519)-N(6))-dimethyltransferase RsmA [Azospirillum rugosum]|uniref:Ribosomal RNA small subunit methyltransferase A n=1 Tax=Azospirillum rugosum TaxID=416170 RepID=A0ABS4SPD9_9PROT|nr:16S rRNA (adenine(1518)-N(6)/adenine(1519)-N(6))-dimethyltransferase RsmA [Azospirillum rugosum]MBP2294426.1 16S rRNA (adenine1518-N6/adenine1519-N6)-dimethyltransferase [Azospirillum rugosum]MDQ0528931.1 16S rRNA (adenine1518-N6/adenine1519-N6)-dimethyltransferase [Azospirillum rugosum]